MRHRVGYNRLSKKTSHRKAMLRNMVTSLFDYERITTTKAKALEVRRKAEKMITRAKEDSVHNRREVAKVLYSKAVISKLFTDIAPRFEKRPGGYTRILKTGFRQGDAAEMVILELVERIEKKSKDSKKQKKAEKPAPVEAKTTEKKASPKSEAKPAEKKPETKKAETKKAETKKVEPKKAEAKKAEPDKTEAKEAIHKKKEKAEAPEKTEVAEKKSAATETVPEDDAQTIAREKSNETGVVETAQQTIIEGE
jgi:large subunit ribosomal protein L17